ncbi:MAG: hypothetical protein M3N34_01385 [Pseudomonadota bacterium]|nr:hypothetical protein [Pseudomonadota bacterium]
MVADTSFPGENVAQFKRLQENWKKSTRIACADSPWHTDIAAFLAARGKELKNERDMACHWPASRAVAQPDGKVHFANNVNLAESVRFGAEDIESLANDISIWGANVGFFGIMFSFDLMPEPSPETRSGDKPEWMSVHLDSYRKTRRRPACPTMPKPSRQPST